LKVKWLNQATLDLISQIDYIAERNPVAAIEQATLVDEKVSNLAQFHEIGRKGRAANTRELVIVGTSFVVVYCIVEELDLIQIIRLLHGSQQWPLEE
jgi:toxin ParE1/3/4